MAPRQMTPFEIEVSECLAAIKNGDETRFERLCKLTNGPLQSVAKRYLVDKSCCEDVVSEVYLNIVKYVDKYTPGRNGFTYLWQIVKNKAFDCNDDYLKHTIVNIDIVCHDTNDEFEESTSQIDLALALKTVGHKNAAIIMWTFKDGLTQEEIGNLLGISKSAVNQRLKSSLKKLLKYYKKG